MTAQPMDTSTLIRAAEQSASIYDSPQAFDAPITVDQFTVGGGQLAGGIRFPRGSDRTTYVVFRGTNSKGNWGLTNLQAYMAEFGLLDAEMQSDVRTDGSGVHARFQGVSLAFPMRGSIHQGFYRAGSYLWYGSEPPFNRVDDESAPYWARVRREIAILALSSSAGGLVGFLSRRRDFLYGGIIAGLLADLVLVGLERGTWEGLFRRRPEVFGIPLCAHRHELAQSEDLVFCGHSLGGALALLCFCMYQEWCKAQSLESKARLITFGSPRVGDNTFVQDFEQKYGDAYWNVVAAGDPVPETPPAGTRDVESKLFKSPMGLILATSKLLWPVYSQSWGQQPVGVWRQRVQLGPEEKSLAIRWHSMSTSYLPLLRRVVPDAHIYPNSRLL